MNFFFIAALQQRPLLPSVKTEHRLGSAANNPYLAFRRRTEKMQTRKNRKNDETSYEKMLKLRRDLSRAVTLLELVKRREKTKREHLHLTIEVYEKRSVISDVNRKEKYWNFLLVFVTCFEFFPKRDFSKRLQILIYWYLLTVMAFTKYETSWDSKIAKNLAKIPKTTNFCTILKRIIFTCYRCFLNRDFSKCNSKLF